MGRILGPVLVAMAFTASAQAAPITLTADPEASRPGVAVGADGTGHFGWSVDVAAGGDQIVYCRVPRGAKACAATQTFTPDGIESFGGVRVLAPADGRVLLIFYRCCGANEGTSVIESTDGGATFGPSRHIGALEPWEAVLGPGDQTVSLTTHVVDGVSFQAAPLAGGSPPSARVGKQLGQTSDFQGYWGSTAFVDAQTPIVGMSDLDRVYVRTWGGSGDYNDVATWGPTQLVGPGDEPKLVSGPRGVHLAYLSGEPGRRSYVVRPRLPDGTFGPASLTTPAGSPLNRDFFQDDGGFLHLAWEDNNTGAMHYRWSKDGKTWSADTVLAKGFDLFNLRLATTSDGGGFSVFDANGSGPIRAVAIPPKGASSGGTGPPKNGECRQQVQITAQVIAQARTGELCFNSGKWKTDQPVVVNGLDFVPGVSGRRAVAAAGASLTIDASDHTIKTSGYRTQAGPVVIDKAPVTWDVDNPKTFENLDKFNVKILGFDVTGKATLDVIGKGKAKIPVQVKLPKFFGGVTAAATLSLDIANPLGLKLDKLSIKQGKGESALFFGLVLTDLDLQYSGEGGPTVFEGTFTLSLPPAQTKTPAITATVKFVDGKFIRGGFPRISFPTSLPLAPPFAYLSAVGFVVEAEPNLKLIGGAEFVGGPDVAGAKLVVVDALPPLSADAGVGGLAVTFGDPTAFDLDGKLKVAGIQIGAGGLHLDTSGLFTFYAGFEYEFFDLVSVKAGIPKFVSGTTMPGAFINFDNGTFGVTIEGSFCSTPLLCGEGQGGLNSRAIYGCGKAKVAGLKLPLKIGAAYEWGKSISDGFHLGCDYGDVIAVRTLRQAGGARTITVPVGLDRVAFNVTGATGAPPVRVTGPDGVDVTSNPDPRQIAVGAGEAAITTFPKALASFVEIAQPAAGTYTIAPTGSVAIAGVTRQDGLRDPKVTATVRKVRGRTFEVRYDITKAPGDAVVFYERSDKANSQLRKVTESEGRFRFSATDGRAGQRRLVALVENAGVPRRELNVTGFTAPGPVRPSKLRNVRVRRSGATLKVSWAKAADAAQYVVRVKLADGRSKLFVLGGAARRFTYRGAGADKGTVAVSGLADNGREGPKGTAKVRKKARRGGRRS